MKIFLKKISVFVIIFLSFLIYYSTIWTLKTFGDVSIEEIIFNLKVPMSGVNTDYIIDYIKQCIFPSAGFSIIIFIIPILERKREIAINITIVDKKFKVAPLKYIKKFSVFLAFILLIASCSFSTKALNINEYAKNEFENSKFLEENYKSVSDIDIKFPENKRNLIYIYLESMEYTYASQECGGYLKENIIPELTEIASDNINFSFTDNLGGLIPMYGSTWTMGAIFAQTSGLPLKLPIYGNNMDQYSTFMPGVKNLGEILENNGYHNVLMLSSDAAYAGRKNYFEQHGNYEIYDYYSAIDEGKISEDYYEWWGYEDIKLFEYSKEKLLKLSSENVPFNFTMLTTDTHFEDGYFCPLCETIHDDQYSNVISCSSKQVSEFINWIKGQDFYDNTTIILVGDHTTMDVDFCESVDSSYRRGVYNAFINSAAQPKKIKNRYATTMDMFPTMLASLGADIEGNRLGLGTNLFSNEQTILEQNNNDVESVNDELRKKSLFYNKTFLYS